MWAPEFDKYEMCLTSFLSQESKQKGKLIERGRELVGGVWGVQIKINNAPCLPAWLGHLSCLLLLLYLLDKHTGPI